MLETNGSLPDALDVVLPMLDIVSMDIKLSSTGGHGDLLTANRRFLELCRDKAHIKIVVSGETDEPEFVEAVSMIASTAPAAPLTIQLVSAAGANDASGRTAERLYARAAVLKENVAVRQQMHKRWGIR